MKAEGEHISGEPETTQEFAASFKACDGIAAAVNADVGAMVEKIQTLILDYYKDVRGQATHSFDSAKKVSMLGFIVVIVTVGYLMVIDLLAHFPTFGFHEAPNHMNVGTIGVISGGVIEFIAAVNFVLWGRATKQFGAFHICLERTHRYLLAYKVAEKIQSNKDQTLEKIVCIMAKAPMITRADIDGIETGSLLTHLRTNSETMSDDKPADASSAAAVVGSKV